MYMFCISPVPLRHLISFTHINNDEKNIRLIRDPHCHKCFLTYYCKSSLPHYFELGSFQVMLFLSRLTNISEEITCCFTECHLEKFDLVCNFKLMESTCHVLSGFISTALGLVNVVLYFSIE